MAIDFDEFRLRPFVERLAALHELQVHDEPVRLIDLSPIIDASTKATLFCDVGAEHYEMVAAVAGSRARLAAALGVPPDQIAQEYLRRIEHPQPPVEVPSSEAPVHEIVLTGDDVDMTKLPFFLQHELDGGPYISSAIDYAVDPRTGRTNVGCRRLMLRDKTTVTSNLTGASDLKDIYRGCVEDGIRLPVNFAIGSHPIDFMAAALRLPGVDEFDLLGRLRGKPAPMVRGVTTGTLVPADAEMVVEGYFDALGWRVEDGPYGEWWGYYGAAHLDPIFHVTAITMRKDALYQTVLHGSRHNERTDGGHVNSIGMEVLMWKALRAAGIEPAALYNVPAAPAGSTVRVALSKDAATTARAAIDALFGVPFVKFVVVVDEDIDIFSDDDVSWALAVRFRADRDLVKIDGFRPFAKLDPTVSEDNLLTKIAFDATAWPGTPDQIDFWRPEPAVLRADRAHTSLERALAEGPKHFIELLQQTGSTDGREIAVALEQLRQANAVTRLPNGEWTLMTHDER